MAVTITRSVWIDDDGTGTTGTVINQALHTTLYNEIDTALAKVAQLAGGNSFTGNQAIAGLLTVTGAGAHTITGAGVTSLVVRNTAPGTSAQNAYIGVANDVAALTAYLQCFPSTASVAGVVRPDGALLTAAGAGGLTVAASAGSLYVFTGGATERLRIASTGEVLIAGFTNVGPGQLFLQCDSAHVGVSVQDVSAAQNQAYHLFFNTTGSSAGSISHTGATTVAFNTTSDARLKDDVGRATDLAALRAVVVHDFAWKADGTRARGIFAQEAYDVFPSAVTKGGDDTTDDGSLKQPWMTDYSKFVSDLIVGWQQHDVELAELRAILAAVKG